MRTVRCTAYALYTAGICEVEHVMAMVIDASVTRRSDSVNLMVIVYSALWSTVAHLRMRIQISDRAHERSAILNERWHV